LESGEINLIKGLYEAHLPVRDLNRSVEFYKKLGLELWFQEENIAFFWIIPKESCLGLWVCDISKERDPSSFPGNGRHIAFWIDFDDIKKAKEWLENRGIVIKGHGGLKPIEPIVRPHLQNSSIYFNDPDENNLELICNLPDSKKEPRRLIYLSEWEELKQNK
jgi:catechol 2,3-dioxygenase-like lactoylglutathione lyase family enzyme